MAGAGYKLFNTGDVLTAAQVNTYLQEQTVMVFNDASARTTALSGVLAEGMVSYLKSTDVVEVYNGSAWVGLAGAGSPLTTKGDIYTYSTTNARLAVGSNGEALVADSAATTGLRYQANFAAGKNKIINGAFDVWQRGTSFTLTTGTQYTADRWDVGGAAGTVSRQAFTVGNAISGYESAYYLDWNLTSNSQNYEARQKIEDVRTFAGQTATFSIWAKISSGTTTLAPRIVQDFGTGGSPSSSVITSLGSMSLTSSWQRFTWTVSVPSISGKTLGTNNNSSLWFSLQIGNTATGTIQLWGAQAELGSVATAFQTATGTLQGELAACQRYYYRVTATNAFGAITPVSYAFDASNSITNVQLPVTMRIVPTAVDFSTLKHIRYDDTNYTITAVTLSSVSSSPQIVQLVGTITGAVAGQVGKWAANNSTTAFLGLSAEL